MCRQRRLAEGIQRLQPKTHGMRRSGQGASFAQIGQGLGQLVGTGGGLVAAGDADQFVDGVLHRHAIKQAAKGLEVAGTAPGKTHVAQHAVAYIELDLLAANTVGNMNMHGETPWRGGGPARRIAGVA